MMLYLNDGFRVGFALVSKVSIISHVKLATEESYDREKITADSGTNGKRASLQGLGCVFQTALSDWSGNHWRI